jgi:hypothetical protein
LNKKREVSIIGTPTKERSYQENLLQKGTPKDYQEHKEGKIEKRRTDISESW